MPISVSSAAAGHIKRQIDGRGRGLGIRIGVRTSGCSGMAYVLEFVNEGLKFNNPNVSAECGCGESFTV